jgi:hypothetical protein
MQSNLFPSTRIPGKNMPQSGKDRNRVGYNQFKKQNDIEYVGFGIFFASHGYA